MAPAEADKPLCFAIMPISMPPERLDAYGGQRDHFVYVAEHLFKPAAEAAGYEFRAPAATNAEIIQAGIIENLWRADLVLCDISAWNPNVFYEFGIRCALNKPVAMVKDDKTERIPFDTAMINCHPYSSDLSIMTVKGEIPKLTTFLEAAKHQTENTVWKYFGIKESADRPQPENPEDAKLDLLLDQIAVLQKQIGGIQEHRLIPEQELDPRDFEKSLEAIGARHGESLQYGGINFNGVRVATNGSLNIDLVNDVRRLVAKTFADVGMIRFEDAATNAELLALTVR